MLKKQPNIYFGWSTSSLVFILPHILGKLQFLPGEAINSIPIRTAIYNTKKTLMFYGHTHTHKGRWSRNSFLYITNYIKFQALLGSQMISRVCAFWILWNWTKVWNCTCKLKSFEYTSPNTFTDTYRMCLIVSNIQLTLECL